MKVLVTGSSGLIGSEAVLHYDGFGHEVHGIDNNLREDFFGPTGSTLWNLSRLKDLTRNFTHCRIDVRDRAAVMALFENQPFDLIIHCAAQPSHDRAREIPFLDFEVNAVGTLNLLEAMRRHWPEAVFCHMSTNKVYGDAPNEKDLVELPSRYDYARSQDRNGIDETCRIDRSLHSLFGVSKAAGDLMAQEYGRTFDLKIGVFRGGCLTGPQHSGVELHGFLSYLAKVVVRSEPYTIFGYKGKQVRDQIHAEDVIAAFDAFANNPRCGEVYNLGGGRENSASVLEAIDRFEKLTGNKLPVSYMPQNRLGDHICYISDLTKIRSHFPQWSITRSLDSIFDEMVRAEHERLKKFPKRSVA